MTPFEAAFSKHPPATDEAESDALIDVSVMAEQALLGVAIYDPTVIDDLCELRPEHFFEPTHGRIFATMRGLAAKGRGFDPVAIWDRMEADAGLVDLGGIRYLADLVDRAPPRTSVEHHAATIIDRAMGRALFDLADTVKGSIAAGVESEEVIKHLETGCAEIAKSSVTADAFTPADHIVQGAIAKAKASKGLPGISTGLRELDKATGGFRRGVMTVLAGRPSMGKSTAGLVIAKASASPKMGPKGEILEPGLGTIFFSMEMPDFDLGLRVACDLAFDQFAPVWNGRPDNPTYFDAAANDLPPHQWDVLDSASTQVADWPLVIDTRPGLTVAQMLAAARRQFRKWKRAGIKPGMIIVDHLTIAQPSQARGGNKVAEVGDISRGLAEMAKILDVAVVALCQLSRDVEKRDSKDYRPRLSDLRWSGEIEQDARLVIFLYRPEYYVKRPEDKTDIEADAIWREKMSKVRNKLFWLVEKNNNGPTGEVETFCSIAHSAIRDRLGTGL